MEPPLKIIAVKSSIAGIGRKLQYISLLKALVANAHTLVLHIFSCLKYIFIHKLENNPAFPLEDFINVDFFLKKSFCPSSITTSQINRKLRQNQELAKG
jgi:hypothetical protein